MTNKEKIKWQKVRLAADKTTHPFFRGKEIWVKIGTPIRVENVRDWAGNKGITYEAYETNAEGFPDGSFSLAVVNKRLTLDLLPEFAEEVEIIPYSVWSTAEVSSPAK